LYRVRERVFADTRGGQRATDLYYQHSPAMVGAATAHANVATLAMDALEEWEPNLTALGGGEGDTVTVTQGQVDALDAFLDGLREVAEGELADAIDRERARVDVGGWVGKTMDETLVELDELSCEGFEATLFCGEVTRDCRITASDALRVLRIAVGSESQRAEADLDGNGSVSASDALLTLRIAVGVAAQTSACNV
jgi:hypothetical protein